MKYLKIQSTFFIAIILTACSLNSSKQVSTTPSSATSTQTPIPTSTLTPTIIPTSTPYAGLSNQLIAFQQDLFGHIFVSDLSGNEPLNITKEPKGFKNLIGWSPDGKWIVFSRTDFNPYGRIVYPNQNEIWVSSPDGSEKHYLGNCYKSDVYWTPDGKYIVLSDYTVAEGTTDAYWIYDTTDFEKKIFLDGTRFVYSCSPNGNFFYTGVIKTVMIDINNDILSTYTDNYLDIVFTSCNLEETDPILYTDWIWFPDSSQYLQVVPCVNSDKNIVIQTTVGEELYSEVIFEWPSTKGIMSISPDGDWILSAKLNGIAYITCYIYNTDFIQISNFPCIYPKWSPDGKQIMDFIPNEQNTIEFVYIDPQTGKISPDNSFQWLNEFDDTVDYGLWQIQPK